MAEIQNGSRALIESAIRNGISLQQDLLEDFMPQIDSLAKMVLKTFHQGGKLFFLGNGGSAAEAQHITTEFVVRFKHDRRSLPCIALNTDTSAMTAIGNDFNFEQVFARQIESLVRPEDMVVALSTSGSSPNVLAAMEMARQKKATTIGFTGNRKGPLLGLVDIAMEVPSGDTQRIQEGHLLIWHIICELVDEAISENEISDP